MVEMGEELKGRESRDILIKGSIKGLAGIHKDVPSYDPKQ